MPVQQWKHIDPLAAYKPEISKSEHPSAVEEEDSRFEVQSDQGELEETKAVEPTNEVTVQKRGSSSAFQPSKKAEEQLFGDVLSNMSLDDLKATLKEQQEQMASEVQFIATGTKRKLPQPQLPPPEPSYRSIPLSVQQTLPQSVPQSVPQTVQSFQAPLPSQVVKPVKAARVTESQSLISQSLQSQEYQIEPPRPTDSLQVGEDEISQEDIGPSNSNTLLSKILNMASLQPDEIRQLEQIVEQMDQKRVSSTSPAPPKFPSKQSNKLRHMNTFGSPQFMTRPPPEITPYDFDSQKNFHPHVSPHRHHTMRFGGTPSLSPSTVGPQVQFPSNESQHRGGEILSPQGVQQQILLQNQQTMPAPILKTEMEQSPQITHRSTKPKEPSVTFEKGSLLEENFGPAKSQFHGQETNLATESSKVDSRQSPSKQNKLGGIAHRKSVRISTRKALEERKSMSRVQEASQRSSSKRSLKERSSSQQPSSSQVQIVIQQQTNYQQPQQTQQPSQALPPQPTFQPPIGMETQTDLNNAQPPQIYRSKRSFQGQVYLDHSQDQLRSRILSPQISHHTLKESADTSAVLQSDNKDLKQALVEGLREKSRTLAARDQDLMQSYKNKQAMIKKNLEDIATLEREILIAKMLMNEQSRPQGAVELATVLAAGQQVPSMVDVSLQADEVKKSIEEAKMKDAETQPMVGEKSTDPKTQDQAVDPWKRDGQAQTAFSMKDGSPMDRTDSTVFVKNQEIIRQNKLQRNGGTQYNLLESKTPNLKSAEATMAEDSQKDDATEVASQDKVIQVSDPKKRRQSRKPSIRLRTEQDNQVLDRLMLGEKVAMKVPFKLLKQVAEGQRAKLLQESVRDSIPTYHDHLLDEVTIPNSKSLFENQLTGRAAGGSRRFFDQPDGRFQVVNHLQSTLPSLGKALPGTMAGGMAPMHTQMPNQAQAGSSLPSSMPSPMGGHLPVALGAMPGAMHGAMQMPGAMPGTMPATMPGTLQGQMPQHTLTSRAANQSTVMKVGTEPLNVPSFGLRTHSLPPVQSRNMEPKLEVGGGTFAQGNQPYYDHLQNSLQLDHEVAPDIRLPSIEPPPIQSQIPPSIKRTHPLKHFKGEDLEQYYLEKQLKPEVEKEIKRGFFEIRKKFATSDHSIVKGLSSSRKEEEVQVYVSHICLHNFHPIFSKMSMETVKLILQSGSIVYLNKGQTLFAPGFNDTFFYFVLFGHLLLQAPKTGTVLGQPMSIGWTAGEEILFKQPDMKRDLRKEICRAGVESCVLGVEKRQFSGLKKVLLEKGMAEEFQKIEIVLRGNHLVKKEQFQKFGKQ